MIIKRGNCLELLKELQNDSIDMVMTSPPYDNLRDYHGYSFDFENIAKELYRVLKQGGVIVWVVSDAVIDGSETGTSFRQALFFKEIGFNIHDTMIWAKDTFNFPDPTRYGQSFEYMFVLSKGSPKTINKICDRRNKWYGTSIHGTSRGVDGITFRKSNDKKSQVREYGERFNIWHLSGEKSNKTGHPAVYPVKLCKDQIYTWTNKGDIVLDPFMGSGSTGVACKEIDREFIGFEISEEYFNIASNRINNHIYQMDMMELFYKGDGNVTDNN